MSSAKIYALEEDMDMEHAFQPQEQSFAVVPLNYILFKVCPFSTQIKTKKKMKFLMIILYN